MLSYSCKDCVTTLIDLPVTLLFIFLPRQVQRYGEIQGKGCILSERKRKHLFEFVLQSNFRTRSRIGAQSFILAFTAESKKLDFDLEELSVIKAFESRLRRLRLTGWGLHALGMIALLTGFRQLEHLPECQ